MFKQGMQLRGLEILEVNMPAGTLALCALSTVHMPGLQRFMLATSRSLRDAPPGIVAAVNPAWVIGLRGLHLKQCTLKLDTFTGGFATASQGGSHPLCFSFGELQELVLDRFWLSHEYDAELLMAAHWAAGLKLLKVVEGHARERTLAVLASVPFSSLEWLEVQLDALYQGRDLRGVLRTLGSAHWLWAPCFKHLNIELLCPNSLAESKDEVWELVQGDQNQGALS